LLTSGHAARLADGLLRRVGETCDTLHAHDPAARQALRGPGASRAAAPARALRLNPRGWETAPLPAPDGSGSFVLALDLRVNEAVLETSTAASDASPRAGPSGGAVSPARSWSGCTNWSARSDQHDPPGGPLDHAARSRRRSRPVRHRAGRLLFRRRPTQAALVLASFRAPYRGRSTPSTPGGIVRSRREPVLRPTGRSPVDDFIMRNAMDAQEVAIGWWPGDRDHPRPRSTPTPPAAPGFAGATLDPGSAAGTPRSASTSSPGATSAQQPGPAGHGPRVRPFGVRHACTVCDWDPGPVGQCRRIATSRHLGGGSPSPERTQGPPVVPIAPDRACGYRLAHIGACHKGRSPTGGDN